VVLAAVVVGVDFARTKQYTATGQVLFVSQNASSNSNSNVTAPLQAAAIATDIQLFQSSPVKERVARDLKAPAPSVSASEIGTTNIAKISVTSKSPAFAAKAANAYAKAYIETTNEEFLKQQLALEDEIQNQMKAIQDQIALVQLKLTAVGNSAATQQSLSAQLSSLYTELGTLTTQLTSTQQSTTQLSTGGQLVSPASVPTSPSSPKRITDALLGAFVGLLLGTAFVLLRDHLDDRIRDKTQLEQLSPEIPVLGLIPVIDGWRDRNSPYLVARSRPKSPASEAYRGLRTSIQFMALENPTKVLQITSPCAGDGKTTTAANVAWIMAEAGQRVVLVGCDLRRPRIHEFFALPNDIGFTSVLLGEAELEDALLWIPNQPRLQVLPTGPIPPNPSELLSGSLTQEVFKSLSSYADIVVVDSAPILPVTDAAVLSTSADAVLLVVSARLNRRQDIVRSLEMLWQINAPIVGTVLNRAPQTDSYEYHHYSYRHSYSHNSSDQADIKTRENRRTAATTENGKGTMGGGTRPSQVLPGEVGVAQGTSIGRHIKLGSWPAPDSPTRGTQGAGEAPIE
jgi:capsular exopolysaccharide synthesis family protein